MMSEQRGWDRGSEGFQLEKADFGEAAAPGAPACAACAQGVGGTYFEAGGQVVCEPCKDKIAAQEARGHTVSGLLVGGGLGFGAALVGALIWWGVRTATGYELGLLAVGVGLLVGFAVRRGAGRGGLRYQILAVCLAYTGVALNYAPDLVKEMTSAPVEVAGEAEPAEPLPLVVAVPIAVVFSYAVPFLGGFENAIGLLIIAFALWEAWKVNRHVPLTITGPYRPGDASPAASVAGA